MFRSDISAFTSTTGSDIPPGVAAIVFNTTSAFFNGNFTVDEGKLGGGSAQAQIFMILHELGHAPSATGFQNDFQNKSAGVSNDGNIEEHCQKTFGSFK